MTAKYVLYFTAAERTLYRRTRGRLERETGFAPDAVGVGEFREYLLKRGRAVYYIVADLGGEDFDEDQIPFLRGADRKAVIDRRLAQRFRDPRVALALSLGSVVAERREERLLLASFADAQQFEPWLDAIAEAGARLAGVYSTALVAPVLAAQLGVRSGPCMVVAATRAGLRQCFVEDGRLRFARLERIADSGPDALAALVRSETMRLANYLVTLRLLPRQAPALRVLVVTPPGAEQAFQQALRSDRNLLFQTVAARAAARAVGARHDSSEAGAERLFLELVVGKTPAEQFVRREERRGFLLWQMQRAIVAAGLAGFAGCALYAGTLGLEAASTREQTALQQREAELAAGEYRRITESFPVTQTTSDNLKATVNEFRAIVARSSTPETSFVQLSTVFERFPQFVLDGLDWSVARPGDAATKPPAAGAGANVPAPQAADGAPGEVIRLAGQITPTPHLDYRAIATQVESLGKAIGALPGYRVLRAQLPFDLTPEGTLSGDTVADDRGEASTRFTLTVARTLR